MSPWYLTLGTATRRRGVRNVRYAAALGVLLFAAGLPTLTGCGGSSTDDYCATVKQSQSQLTKVLGEGGQAALLDALPTFRSLQAKAPDDIAHDWATVVGRLTTLQKAITAAGVDPKTYDAKHPPAGVTSAQQQAIAAAATALGSTSTATALDAVQQQARDVCHTPLTL